VGVSVTPSSAQQIEWQVHPTVVTQSGSSAEPIGPLVTNFVLTNPQFDSLIAGGSGVQPVIRIDCENAGRTLIMPLVEFTGSPTFQFQVLGWSYSRPASAWICQAVTHSPTAVNASNTADAGTGLVIGGVTYRAFGLLGVTTTSGPDGDGGVVPLPSHYEYLPVEGLRAANAATLAASSAIIQVNNSGWRYLTIHLRQTATTAYTCNFRCLYTNTGQIFR
jgi:hypothetical protein